MNCITSKCTCSRSSRVARFGDGALLTELAEITEIMLEEGSSHIQYDFRPYKKGKLDQVSHTWEDGQSLAVHLQIKSCPWSPATTRNWETGSGRFSFPATEEPALPAPLLQLQGGIILTLFFCFGVWIWLSCPVCPEIPGFK